MNELLFRKAERCDVPKILAFIKDLAEYEHLSSQVMATEELLDYYLFVDCKAEVLFAEIDGQEIGFALYYYSFSTFQGRTGIYLEDLFVKPEYRGNGYGKALLRKLARIAVERGHGRLEWSCLTWNKPSLNFYYALNPETMNEWIRFRLSDVTLDNLAKS